uniref:PAK1 interacting protein 1 n=1 Tax=Lepisosteus oculatus TaxID=7918 RepID=W5N6G2_LEPOC
RTRGLFTMDPAVVLVAGCYEQITFGYRVETTKEMPFHVGYGNDHHAHSASLSVVATNEKFIATGSRDETICLYDMKKRTEHGALLHHDGTITCLEFYGSSHLLSGGEDGLICIWSTKKWECLQSIKAHKGQVSSFSVHPSGKLALSVGTDKTLRTWNLIDGRSAFIKNIKENAHIVLWSPAGDKYVVVADNKIDVYSLETATVTRAILNQKRISSVKFVTNSIVAVAGDEECLRLYDTDSGVCLSEFKAHENRVKALSSFTVDDRHILASASNDGYIKMWKLNLEQMKDPPVLLGEVNTTARLACLDVWQCSSQKRTLNREEATASSPVREKEDTPAKTKKGRPACPGEVVEVEDGDGPAKKRKTDGSKRKKKQ